MVTSNVINGLIDNSKNNGNISSTTKNDKSNSSLDVNDFLQLLVAQMQYQDPLEPTDNTQYIAQMATFTQVEGIKRLSIPFIRKCNPSGSCRPLCRSILRPVVRIPFR